jgi:hypothetical protein
MGVFRELIWQNSEVTASWYVIQTMCTSGHASRTTAKEQQLRMFIDTVNASPFLHLSLRQSDQAYSCQTETEISESFLSAYRKPGASRDHAGEFAEETWVTSTVVSTWASVVLQVPWNLFVITHIGHKFFVVNCAGCAQQRTAPGSFAVICHAEIKSRQISNSGSSSSTCPLPLRR